MQLEPRLSPAVWILHLARAFPPRHATGGGNPDAPFSRGFSDATGPLTEQELSALALLRGELSSLGERRSALLTPVLSGALPEERGVARALALLIPRAEVELERAASLLTPWAEHLERVRPSWFERVSRRYDRFFGCRPDQALIIYLVPGVPAHNGWPVRHLFGAGATTIECSGAPVHEDGFFWELFHEAAHARQSEFLDRLIVTRVSTACGRRVESLFAACPMAALRPEPTPAAKLQGYLAEIVVHSIVQYGALRPRCVHPPAADHWQTVRDTARRVLRAPGQPWGPMDLFAAWMLAGAAGLLPLARSYLTHGRPVDAAYVDAAFGVFEALHRRWDIARAGRCADQLVRCQPPPTVSQAGVE